MKTYSAMLIICVFIFPAYSETGYSNPYLDLGIFAFEENDFASAISHLKRAMLKQPDNPVVYHYLAKTYQKMKRFMEARHYYEQAYDIDPNLEDLIYDRGYFNYLTQQYQAALNDFIQSLKQKPDNLMAQYYAGICAFKTDQYQIALHHFLASAKQPSNIKDNCEYYAAVCCFQTGKTAQAHTLFNNISMYSNSRTLRRDAKKWLDILNDNPSLFRPYHLYADITMTYDDNIKLVPSDEKVGDKDDLLIKTFLRGRYNFVQSPIYNMGIEYSHLQTNHVDFSDYNIVGSAGQIFYQINHINTIHSLYLCPEYIWLNNKKYSSNQGLEYDIAWQKSKYLKLLANFEYAFYNNFVNNDYDGQAINFDIGMERTFPDNENLAFISGISIVNKDTDGNDKKYQKGTIGCGIRFQNNQLKWLFGGRYSVRHYMYEDSNFQRRRNDKLSWFLTQFSLIEYKIQPAFQIDHQVNSSNIDQYDYTKTAISFSLRYFY
jgi:tetratricopeptide (TPR) repeat protein